MPKVWREIDDYDAKAQSDVPYVERLRYWKKVLQLREAWKMEAERQYAEAVDQIAFIEEEIAWVKKAERPGGESTTTTTSVSAPASSITSVY